jgi:hypothetical protein
MNGGVVGVFIAPTTKLDRWWRLSVQWRTGQSGAHRTCPVPQPRHQCRWNLTIGVLTSEPAPMSGGAPDMNCSVSGAPVWARLPSARAARAFNVLQVVVAPRMHRTCPVCTGHVRWHTGQSGAPDQRCLQLFLAPLFEPNTWSFYWLSVNLWHLYNLCTREN